MNISSIIDQSALYFPNRPAVCIDGQETTYAGLNERADRIAAAIVKLGISPGDYVALCAPNSLEWIAFYFGVIKTGAIAATMSSRLTAREFTLAIQDTKPKCIFTTEEYLEILKPMQKKELLETIIL